MKKKVFVVLSVMSLFVLSAAAQSVDEIVKKNIEAHGGYEAQKNVNSMIMKGTITQMGMEISMKMYQKRPNKRRMEATVQGMTIVDCFDGETAWMINPITGDPAPREKSPEEAKLVKNDADFDGHLLDYKEKGHTVELLGTEDLEGTEVYKLKVTLKSGTVVYYYLDTEHCIELKTSSTITQQGQEIVSDTFFSDYKPVGELMVAHAIEQHLNGQTSMQIAINEVIFNSEIDDSLFEMPSDGASE